MARVEIPAPGDLIMDEAGNIRVNETVTLTLASDRVGGVLGTGSAATHYSALTGGTSTTGGLKSGSEGTIVDGSGNRRYVDSGVALDLTILGRARQIEPMAADSVGHVNPGTGGSVQSAITAAALVSGTVVIDRAYTLSTGVTVPNNVTIDIRSTGSLDFTTLATGGTCIDAAGTEGSTVALTANATAGTTTLTCAAGGEAGIAANDWLRVAATTVFDPLRTASPIGEMVQVLSTASGSITLRSPLRDTYVTADTAVFSKVTMRTGVTIKGTGTITCGDQHTAVRFDRALACHVDGLLFRGTSSSCAVYFRDSVGCRARYYDAQGFNYVNNGYGADFDNACMDCRVVGATFRNCRHATTTGNSASRKGIARDCWVEDCDAYDTTGDCFDTHAASEFIHFRNCRSYDSVLSGFNVECPAASVEGCEVYRAIGYGICFINWSARATRYKCSGNTVTSSTLDGIRYGNGGVAGAGSSISWLTISDNVVDTPGAIGIYAASTDSWRIKNLTCTGNLVHGCTSTTAAFYFNKGDGGEFTGNQITAAGSTTPGMRFLDWTAPDVGSLKVSYAANGSNSGGLYFQTVSDGVVGPHSVFNGGVGVRFDSACTNCSLGRGRYPSCTSTIILSTGLGHSVPDNPLGSSQSLATDVAFALTPWTSPRQTFHTGTLTANRIVTLSTTNAYQGMRFRLTRTGGGAFTLDVGTGPLKSLATNTWCEVFFDGAAWKLAAYGTL